MQGLIVAVIQTDLEFKIPLALVTGVFQEKHYTSLIIVAIIVNQIVMFGIRSNNNNKISSLKCEI